MQFAQRLMETSFWVVTDFNGKLNQHWEEEPALGNQDDRLPTPIKRGLSPFPYLSPFPQLRLNVVCPLFSPFSKRGLSPFPQLRLNVVCPLFSALGNQDDRLPTPIKCGLSPFSQRLNVVCPLFPLFHAVSPNSRQLLLLFDEPRPECRSSRNCPRDRHTRKPDLYSDKN